MLPLEEALGALAAALRGLDSKAMIIGGLAVMQRGFPRMTMDVDATISRLKLDVGALLESLAAHGIEPRIPDAAAFARRQQILLLRHRATGTQIDLSIAWLPFELEALERSTEERFMGTTFPVATAEDLIIYKGFAWRPQDQQDLERLLLLHGPAIDLARVRRILGEFLTLLEEPERMEAFEALLKRCGFAP